MRRMTSRTNFDWEHTQEQGSRYIYAPNGGDGTPLDGSKLEDGLYMITQHPTDNGYEIQFPSDRLIISLMSSDLGYTYYDEISNDGIMGGGYSYIAVAGGGDDQFYMLIKNEFVILMESAAVDA